MENVSLANPSGPVLVCGLGRVGSRVAEFLRQAGLPVVALDQNADPTDPRWDGLTVTRGDCREPRWLIAAGVETARGVVICTSDDLTNIGCALAARRLNPTVRLVVRMFNQTLVSRLGAAVPNTTALSVSALTAPLLVVTALTGDSLGAFPIEGSEALRVADWSVGPDLVGRRLADVAAQFRVLVVAQTPRGGASVLFTEVSAEDRLRLGDRVTVCGLAGDVAALVNPAADPLSSVFWAGRVRRATRSLVRAVEAIDTSVKVGLAVLVGTLLLSTVVFRVGLQTSWAEGLLLTVRTVGTTGDLRGEELPGWAKVFLSGLRVAGSLLVAGFTAIFTQYLIRAKLGGVFEARKIPDSGHVVVVGLGNIGFRCVEELIRRECSVVVIESDGNRPAAATVRRMKVPVIIGDATMPAVLTQARVAGARAVLATTASELTNLEVALLVREQNPNQRVVVRLSDPDFAAAVRAAADLPLAASASALAAPAFVAALSGDRVLCLVPVAGRTLAVVELTISAGDACLDGVSLTAAMIDYHLLPLALAGRPVFPIEGIPRVRLSAGDRLTALVELEDLARLLRREPARADFAVLIEQVPAVTADELVPVVRAARGCDQAEAAALVQATPFVLASALTRGAAEELLSRVARERAVGRVMPNPPAEAGT